MSTERKTPLWLWPNLLSLDAPLVALAWLYMFSRAWKVNYLPYQAYIVLGLGVWVIYVLDRLLDRRVRAADDPLIGARHEFHAKHRKVFIALVMAALTVISVCVFTVLPSDLLISYCVPAVLLVLAFFGMVLVSADNQEVPYMRNLVAGLAFGYGTAMMAHIYVPSEGMWSLIAFPRFSPELRWEAVAFSILCVFNITAIHLWEHSRISPDPEVKEMDEMVLTVMLVVLAGFAMLFAYLDNPGMFGGSSQDHQVEQRPFFYAILVAAALLQVINRNRQKFSLDAQRSLADLAMVVPLPLFWIFERS